MAYACLSSLQSAGRNRPSEVAAIHVEMKSIVSLKLCSNSINTKAKFFK